MSLEPNSSRFQKGHRPKGDSYPATGSSRKFCGLVEFVACRSVSVSQTSYGLGRLSGQRSVGLGSVDGIKVHASGTV